MSEGNSDTRGIEGLGRLMMMMKEKRGKNEREEKICQNIAMITRAVSE